MYFVWALAITGLFLVFLEFLLPSAIMAIGGAILLLTSLFFFHMANSSLVALLGYTSILVLITFFVIKIALWKANHSKKENSSEQLQEGFQALIYPKELVGKIGIAATDLVPSGHVQIDERSFIAISKTGHINKGSQIQVLRGKGTHLLVKAINTVSVQNIEC